MTMTLILHTQMGPYASGTVLTVSTNYAKQLINQYGQNLDIHSPHGGSVYWFQDGMVLNIFPQGTLPNGNGGIGSGAVTNNSGNGIGSGVIVGKHQKRVSFA